MTVQSCQLYLISPASIEIDAFIRDLDQAFQGGQVAAFQLRLKDVSDEFIIKAGKSIKEICHKNNTQFILNDRPDLARLIDADGVHLGEDDISIDEARKIIGNNKIIGVSCYDSVDRAIDLCEKGADYVAFGAFFPTTSKQNVKSPKVDIINWWVTNSTIPCVAIGGINQSNCEEIVKNAPDFIAVISYVWNHEQGSKIAVMELLDKIDKVKNSR